jgi:hypothetical protein
VFTLKESKGNTTMLTENEIDKLEGRKCLIFGVRFQDEEGKWIEPVHTILGAWEDEGDVRVLLDPPCVDGGTTLETVSIDDVWFAEHLDA